MASDCLSDIWSLPSERRQSLRPRSTNDNRRGRGLLCAQGMQLKISVAPSVADLTPQLKCSEAQLGEHRLKVKEVLPRSPPAKHPTRKDLAMQILTQCLTEPRYHYRPSKCAYMPESSINDMRLHFQPTPAILSSWQAGLFAAKPDLRGSGCSERGNLPEASRKLFPTHGRRASDAFPRLC